jgi:hypothetical protein
MRNVGAELRLIERTFMLGGALFLLGLIALAIGTEIMILEFWSTDPVKFWVWQGAWAIAQSLVLSSLAQIAKSTHTKNG